MLRAAELHGQASQPFACQREAKKILSFSARAANVYLGALCVSLEGGVPHQGRRSTGAQAALTDKAALEHVAATSGQCPCPL